MSDRRKWVRLSDYCDEYSLDPRTVKKYAEAGLIQLERIVLAGRRPILRVRNRAPFQNARQGISDTTS